MSVSLDQTSGVLTGEGVSESARRMKDLGGVFRDEPARSVLNQEQVVYRVQAWEPQPEGTPGAVCLATTFLEPGKVGDEYYITRGHYHANEDRPEMEVVIAGRGALVLMDRDRNTRLEEMRPGSVHHVPPGTAHRVANTGDETLVFVSYWASETGHDYETIREGGFSARVREIDGRPELVPEA
jgi:glucose-6-phosphate isomerase, archaeal